MTCHHVGEELVWEVAVPIPAVPEFSYKYAVVDEQVGGVEGLQRLQGKGGG